MAVRPYPSNTIILNIDDRVMNRNLKLALERSWTYVGDTIVRTHTSPEDYDPYNYIHVLVKFGTRHYLLSNSSEDADTNWEERIEQHLASTIYKLGNHIKIYNRNARKMGEEEISYEYIEIELEAGTLTLQFRLDSNSDLPVECAAIATQIRAALNQGQFGEHLSRVIVPSLESYAQQEAAYAALAPEREAQKAAEEEAARIAAEEARIAAEKEAEELFLESPVLVQALEEEQTPEESEEKVEVTPLTAEEWEVEYGFDEPDFAIDYHVWELVYEDGSSRTFDSEEETFIS